MPYRIAAMPFVNPKARARFLPGPSLPSPKMAGRSIIFPDPDTAMSYLQLVEEVYPQARLEATTEKPNVKSHSGVAYTFAVGWPMNEGDDIGEEWKSGPAAGDGEGEGFEQEGNQE